MNPNSALVPVLWYSALRLHNQTSSECSSKA